jgi:hypothetical protein
MRQRCLVARQNPQLKSESVLSYCRLCRATTEECQGPEHLGVTPCMECGDGLVDEANRECANCVDQPYRSLREAALGRPIIYTSERPRSYLL